MNSNKRCIYLIDFRLVPARLLEPNNHHVISQTWDAQEAMDQMNACEGDEACQVSANVRSAVASNYKTMVEVLRPGNKGA